MMYKLYSVLTTLCAFMLVFIAQPTRASWDDVKDPIVTASQVTDVAIDTLTAFVYMESSFRVAVKSKTSSATGLMQITNPTWNYLVRTYGPKYGIDRSTSKADPAANIILGAEYFKENRRILSNYLGRLPNDLEAYFAHKFGPDRAARFIRSSNDTPLVDFYPGAASANKRVYYKDGVARTIGDVKGMFSKRMRYAKATYGGLAVDYKDKVLFAERKRSYGEWISEWFYTDTPNTEHLTTVSLKNYPDAQRYKINLNTDRALAIYNPFYPSGRKYNDLLI